MIASGSSSEWNVSPRSSDAVLTMMLASGGDERIAIDPLTGRNRYGTPAGCASGEVWFASSTASAISPRGRAAADAACRAMIGGDTGFHGPSWFARLRARLADLFCPAGAEVVLTSSGTEAELIVLTLAHSIFKGPLANLIVAPGETGSGVPLAADGRHFLSTTPHGDRVVPGERLQGFDALDLRVHDIAIRSPAGRRREAADVDRDCVDAAEAALRDGRAVIGHVLDTSKTGHFGLRRATAAALLARAPDRLMIVVDACQLRCSAEQIRRDLEAGFVVMITGSKFAGGPPFAGAVLVPAALAGRLDGIRLPTGLGAYSACHDWPASLRGRVRGAFGTAANLGLGLRWEAALAELEPFFQIEAALRNRIIGAFGSLVRAAVEARAGLRFVDDATVETGDGATIFPIVTSSPGGRAVDADRLRNALRAPSESSHPAGSRRSSDRAFHVGQPVRVGDDMALRVCLGMPQIVDLADRLRGTRVGGDHLTRWLADDLDDLFSKWSAIAAALD